VAEVKRRRVNYGRLVFLLGDFNLRLGSVHLGRRVSPDTRAPNSPRVRHFRRALRVLGMLPVHGRAEHLPATFTSKYIIPGQSGFSEVDYIIASTELPASMFRLIAAPTWGSNELPPGTHLPLMVEIELPPDDAAAEVPPPRGRKPLCCRHTLIGVGSPFTAALLVACSTRDRSSGRHC
jgi:hypothetical protein